MREFLIKNDNVTAVMLGRDHSVDVEGITQFYIRLDFAVGDTSRFRLPTEFYQTIVERGDLASRTNPLTSYAMSH